jgi:hypothetical protein
MIRVVLDTNIVVSALLRSGGLPEAVFNLTMVLGAPMALLTERNPLSRATTLIGETIPSVQTSARSRNDNQDKGPTSRELEHPKGVSQTAVYAPRRIVASLRDAAAEPW